MISIFISILVSFSHADLQCVEKLDQQKVELDKVQEDYDNGDKNIIDLLDAKLATNQQAWDCGLVSKYNYCAYQQNVMNKKIEHFEDDETLETPLSNAKLTQEKIDKLVYFCTHPDAKL